MKYAIAGLMIFGALLSGCGGDDDDGMTGDVNVTGTWDAVMTVTGGTQAPAGMQFTAVLTLAQSGSSVTGTFRTEGGLSGQVSGSVSGQFLSFTLSQGYPCSGTFRGSGTVNDLGTRFPGSYSGSDCHGTLEASVVATKR